jgi:cell division protein FtsB
VNNLTPQPYWKRHATKILLLALAALVLYDVFGEHGLLAMLQTRRQIQDLQQQIQRLNEDNRRLAEQVNSLKSDPQEIERIAREQMGMARPGEMIFRLPPRTDSSPESAGNPEPR